MKQFIKRILLFVCLPISFGLITYEVLARSLDNSYKVKDSYIKKNGQDIELLILGSSHTFYGINPEYLDIPAYNLANVSQDLKTDYMLLERYDRYLPNLKTIILPISLFSFWSNLGESQEDWRQAKYSIYMDLALGTKNKFEFLYPQIFDIVHLIKPKPVEVTDKGMGLSYSYKRRQLDLEKSAKSATTRHNKSNLKLNFNENILAVENVFKYAKKNNIKIILLRTPVSPKYLQLANSTQVAMLDSVLNKMSKKQGILYLDYWGDQNNKENWFYDADHLNDFGSKEFTCILNEHICKNL